MSITTPPSSATTSAQATQAPQQITVISHSTLFYWWPVWAVGFIMALLTWIDGTLLVVVPGGTKAYKEINVQGDKYEGYVLPKGGHVTRVNKDDLSSETRDPKVHISQSKNYGVVFCIVLLLVIVITNVPLRGMWSVVVILTLVMLSIIFWLARWWEAIFNAFHILDIRINMGGYLFIAIGLFIAWIVTMVLFDKQVYIVFEPGQFKVCTEIGGGEKVYDTIGMSLERQRADLFRHVILGLGSGDLIVKTTGAQAHHFDLPNVLFIGRKVAAIEAMLRSRANYIEGSK